MRFYKMTLILFLFGESLLSAGKIPPIRETSSCITSLKAAVHGIFYDEHGHLLSVAPLHDSAIVVDSNILISMDRVLKGGAHDGNRRSYAYLVKLKKTAERHGENFHIWLTNQSAKEVALAQRVPAGTRIVPITVSRDSTEYKSVLKKLEEMNVGEQKAGSNKDREIISDLFFAKKRTDSTIPTFATADNGIIRPLCLLNPACTKIVSNKMLIKDRFPDGFEATLTDSFGQSRTIRIIAI